MLTEAGKLANDVAFKSNQRFWCIACISLLYSCPVLAFVPQYTAFVVRTVCKVTSFSASYELNKSDELSWPQNTPYLFLPELCALFSACLIKYPNIGVYENTHTWNWMQFLSTRERCTALPLQPTIYVPVVSTSARTIIAYISPWIEIYCAGTAVFRQ